MATQQMQQTQQETTEQTIMDTSMIDTVLSDVEGTRQGEQVNNLLTTQLAAAFAEAETSEDDDRLTGAGASDFRKHVGRGWQVNTVKQGQTMDRAEVTAVVRAANDGPSPSWYKPDAPSYMGEFGSIGSASYPFDGGMWSGHNGAVTCAAYDGDDIVYFLINYYAPRPYTPAEQQESVFLEEDGSAGMRYYSYKFVQGATGLINAVNPADNFIQAFTGTNLDVFSPDKFGSSLSWGEIGGQLLQGIAERVGLGNAFGEGASRLAQITLAITAGSSGAKVTLDIIEKEGLLPDWAVGTGRVVVSLMGGLEVFVKLRGGDALSAADYLTTLITLADAGAEVRRSFLGADSDDYWNKHADSIKELSSHGKNALDALAMLKAAS